MKAKHAVFLLLCGLNGYSQTSFTVRFAFDQYQLTEAGRRQLDSCLVAEKENLSQCSFRLDGYCDFIGTNEYNQLLSERRVSAVKQYLLDHGIASGAITETKAHGENNPLNENKTEADRRLNRRVELAITRLSVAKEEVKPAIEKKVENPPANDTKSLTEKIADTATRAGTQIVLKNINFFGGSPFLLPESSPILDELIEVMRVNRSLVIEIQGHICCIPGPDDTRYGGTGNGLSEERAKMIYAELIGKGIEASRVSYKGFGHSMPIYPYPEKNEEERIANRRVEIKIIHK